MDTDKGLIILGRSAFWDPFTLEFRTPRGVFGARCVERRYDSIIKFSLTSSSGELLLVAELDKVFESHYKVVDSVGASMGRYNIDAISAAEYHGVKGERIKMPNPWWGSVATIGSYKVKVKYRYYFNPKVAVTLPESALEQVPLEIVLMALYFGWDSRFGNTSG